MITTTQGKVVKAYKTISKISNGSLPLPVAYGFFKLKKNLKAQFEFQLEEERKIIEDCKAIIDSEGNWTFDSTEERDTFIKRLSEVSEMPVSIDMESQSVPLDANLLLSVEDMEALEGFVEFV